MRNLIVLLFFSGIFVFDIIIDMRSGVAISHVWHEVVLFCIAFSASIWQLTTIIKKNKHISSLNTELLETKKSYQQWKERTHASAQQIRELIDVQFGLWHLSQSERDVALLLIKGLSMKEIADIRSTHEKTVRQQATSIYKKSSLSGRQELAAFFLEDILSMPQSPAPASAQ
ncbi:MAG: helix-turn-helix transcriptional regulator [Bacteriovoracaceae bacterium]|nr:helix-turn-helix transcriptional regulator [Bacteriovoracaceae bacterium]